MPTCCWWKSRRTYPMCTLMFSAVLPGTTGPQCWMNENFQICNESNLVVFNKNFLESPWICAPTVFYTLVATGKGLWFSGRIPVRILHAEEPCVWHLQLEDLESGTRGLQKYAVSKNLALSQNTTNFRAGLSCNILFHWDPGYTSTLGSFSQNPGQGSKPGFFPWWEMGNHGKAGGGCREI